MSCDVSHNRTYRVKCLVNRCRRSVPKRRTATLRDVIPAATAAAQLTRGRFDQRAGRQAELTGRFADRNHHGRPVRWHACHNRSEEHTSELQSRPHLVCRLLLEKKKKTQI